MQIFYTASINQAIKEVSIALHDGIILFKHHRTSTSTTSSSEKSRLGSMASTSGRGRGGWLALGVLGAVNVTIDSATKGIAIYKQLARMCYLSIRRKNKWPYNYTDL